MDRLTPEQRRKNMQAVRSKDSKMEKVLEEMLLKRGLRGFEKNLPSVYGTPDFVWLDLKVAVFCDSEFFHGKDWETRKHDISTNRQKWWDKIEANVENDKLVTAFLCVQNYTVIRFWGKDVMNQTAACADRIEAALHAAFKRKHVQEAQEASSGSERLFTVLARSEVPFPAPKKPQFEFIDLFAGIGGFRLAMQNLGGKCVFSSEIDANACKTYEANFGENPEGDLTLIEAEAVPDHDLLCGGFPCQAFSIAGKRGGFEDTRGTLFFDVARILRQKRPKAFFLENVKGLVNHAGGKTLSVILNVLRNDLGYFVPEPKVMNAKDFGVPQNRERIFIVGFRDDLGITDFQYPEPSGRKVTFADVKEATVVPSKYYVSAQYLASMKAHRQRHESKGNGFGYEIIADDGIANAIVVGGMGRERNMVIDERITDFTPMTHIKGEINREYVRRMTPREWARLQGFPDEYKIVVADVHAYKQFGNSVAVPAIGATAAKILEKLFPPAR